MGGGGGSTDIQQITPGTIKPFQKFYTSQLNQFGQNQTLLKAAESGALGFFGQLAGPQADLWKYYSGVAAGHGALTPEQERDVSQQTRTLAESYGTGRQLGTLGTELLNRQSAQEARLRGAVSGLQATQGLQTGGLNQLIGAENAKVGSFVPIAQLAQNPVLANLQAQIAQAQIAAQENISGKNSTSDIIGGAIKGLGSIAGGIAMSDRRMKKNVRATPLRTKEGYPLKTFEYVTNPGKRFASVMAQDVEKKEPHRVLTEPRSGVKFVVGFPIVEVSAVKDKKAG